MKNKASQVNLSLKQVNTFSQNFMIIKMKRSYNESKQE